MRSHVRFYASAAAAQLAGFRACKRCRPNATPGSPAWDTRADVAGRAMRLIADGLVDRQGVPGLAAQLGYSVRQLERTLSAEVGAGPIAIARAQRAQTARVLIETTALPMTDVAFAAGFSSIRQFNDTVRAVFASSPSQLRSRVAGPSRGVSGAGTDLVLRLPFRQPLCPDNLFGHLAATAVPGVEEVCGTTYRRTLGLAHGFGIVELTPTPEHIVCRAVLSDLRDLTAAIARCRWLLDLDADPIAIDRHLGSDPSLRPIIGNHRAGGCPDASTAARWRSGSSSANRCRRLRPGPTQPGWSEPMARSFRSPTAVSPTCSPPQRHWWGPASGCPAPADGPWPAWLPHSGTDAWTSGRDATGRRPPPCSRTCPGIGPWTTQMIAMRALGDPDAFPASDLGVLRGAEATGLPATPAGVLGHSASWRPWRAYAVQYLWSATDHPINRWPPDRRPTGTRPKHSGER